MTRKHYRLIAFTILQLRDPFVRAYVARAFCVALGRDNAAFKPGVFMKACGVEA
jgi:hypothetical protein